MLGELGCLKGWLVNLCFLMLNGIYLCFLNLKLLLFVGMMLKIMLYILIGFIFCKKNLMYGNIFLKYVLNFFKWWNEYYYFFFFGL